MRRLLGEFFVRRALEERVAWTLLTVRMAMARSSRKPADPIRVFRWTQLP